MKRLAIADPPRRPGAYAWLYTDVCAGPYTAVCIFLVGSIFSPRYAARRRRGGLPLEHCAVNFALYRDGRRVCWVLSEYAGATVRDAATLGIGGSVLRYGGGDTVQIEIRERTAVGGRPVSAFLTLVPLAYGPVEPVALGRDGTHLWHPIVPRAVAHLVLPDAGIEATGLGYHDANRGDEPLADGIPGWQWSRIHDRHGTRVSLRLPAAELSVDARSSGVSTVTVGPPVVEPTRASGWGLRVPVRADPGVPDLPRSRVLESSPFYVRYESATPGHHALGEVADFRRFASPLVRWMARVRTRVERVA